MIRDAQVAIIRVAMSTPVKLMLVAAFAIAMANVEAAVVVYLREVYGIDDLVRDLPREFDRLTAVELSREAATLVMLLTVGLVAGRRLQDGVGYFVFAFGVWDIAYYGWLFVFKGWPSSLLEWDILFLLPLPWWGPVLAPMMIAGMMCVGGAAAVVQVDRGIEWRMTWTNAGIAAAGIAVCLYAFMADAISAIPEGRAAVEAVRPTDFQWGLFLVGFAVMSWAGLRVTWPGESRLLLTGPTRMTPQEVSSPAS
jgi:hypothetical protein